MPYYVYILATAWNGTFYTGITNDLKRRIWEHKQKLVDGFTKKYHITQLVYFETHDEVTSAIQREKLIKKWRRRIKMEAIERINPNWKDLYEEICN